MDQRIMGILFFTLFISIFFGIHYYLFARIVKIFDIKNTVAAVWIMIALFLSYPAAMILENFSTAMPIRAFYYFSSLWTGVMFLALAAFILHDLIVFALSQANISIDIFRTGIAVIIIVIIASMYGLVNASRFQVISVEIPIDNLDPKLEGYTIVQLSDIHVGPINGPEFIRRIVDDVNKLDADIVVITGDLFDGSSKRNFTWLTAPLKDIKSKNGAYFVTGNHETYVGVEKSIQALKTNGVQTLRDEIVVIGGVQFIGIDNPRNDMAKDNHVILELKDQIDPDKPSILLYHIPKGLDDASEAGVDVQLSGHTHGGQIFPFALFEIPLFPITRGLKKIGNTWLYVSAGTGTWGPPMRVGVPAEISKITLTRAKH